MIKTTTPERNAAVKRLGGSTTAPTWAAFLGDMQLLLLLVALLLAPEVEAGE